MGLSAGDAAPRLKGPAGNRRLVRRPRAGLTYTPLPGGPGTDRGHYGPLREELAGLGLARGLVPGSADPGPVS